MKVTVCFGSTRIVVPCGSGEISVGDLQQKACIRYRRAIGKDANYAVKILKLESSSDGGILDVEDMVNDVVEDKDKLVAIYEEEDPSHGDWEQGSAASSEGKSTSQHSSHLTPHFSHSSSEFEQRYFSVAKYDSPNQYAKMKTSIETRSGGFDVTETDARQMIPHEKSMSPISFQGNHVQPPTSGQIGLLRANGHDPNALANNSLRHNMRSPISDEKRGGILKKRSRSKEQPYFQSDNVTLQPSIGGSHLPSIVRREEVYSASPNSSANFDNGHIINEHTSMHPMTSWLLENSRDVRFVNDGTVESISVREHFDLRSNLFVGLLVQAITQKSSTKSNCRLSSGDVIISINDQLLVNYNFNEAEALLTQSLAYSEVYFRVLSTQNGRKPSRDPYSFQDTLASLIAPEEQSSIPAMSPTSINTSSSGKRNISSDSANSSHNSSYAKPLTFRSSSNHLSKKSTGNQITIQLVKDHQGLGFSLTTNDTATGDLPGPLYVQEILSNGPAMKNGKLLVNDKLLEINGVSVLGKTQQDVVDHLRSIEAGAVVAITVSRYVENMPRKLKQNPDVDHVTKSDQKEYFTYDVALNDTGSAGLGIGLKGNQNTRTGQDLGVFVRSVFHGGAAWQDGRLKPNDQLIEVNGHSLRGISNQAAIGILRTSMSTEGNVRGMIQLTIARRKLPPERFSSDASSEMSDLFPESRGLTRSDSSPSLHTKQSSLPSLFLETSFGPNDIGDVTSHGFNSFTLGRIRKKKKSNFVVEDPYVAHTRSQSSTVESDTMDAELVSQVHQKIFHSSSSSSSIIGNLLSSSFNSSGFNRAPPGNSPYSTWTLPRTNRAPKKNLSFRSTKTNTIESIVSAVEDSGDILDFQSSLDNITAANSQKHNEEQTKENQNPSASNNAESSDNKLTEKEMAEIEQPSPPPEESIQPLPPVKMRQHLTASPPVHPTIRRSISTESMVMAADELNKQLQLDKNTALSKDKPEVGPFLGIAKSSSLESLQTAVESCIAEQNTDPSVARPLPKTVRGRVLNDSFRAALNRTYDLAEGMPLQRMEAPLKNDVPENYAPIIKPRGDSASKSNKKKSRFFGLFKTSKTKKPEIVANPSNNLKLSEKDVHKRSLEASREKDFERMKEENERIQTKAKELREKQAAERKKEKIPSTDQKSEAVTTQRSPSVPITTMKRVEEFYLEAGSQLDQNTVNSNNREGRKEVLTTVQESKESSSTSKKSRKRSKSENRKFKDSAAAYNSLPRQPRRKNSEPWDNDSIVSGDPSSVHRVDNFSFYNRNKPESKQGDLPRALQNRSNIDSMRPTSPEDRAKSPASTLSNSRGTGDSRYNTLGSKPPRSNGQMRNPPTQLVSSPDNASKPSFMRKKSSNAKQNPKIRHSIYTDQPSAFSQYSTPRAVAASAPVKTGSASGHIDSNVSMLSPSGRLDFDSPSSLESAHTASSSGLEVVERNRKAYYRIKQKSQADGGLEKIEMSVPCNL